MALAGCSGSERVPLVDVGGLRNGDMLLGPVGQQPAPRQTVQAQAYVPDAAVNPPELASQNGSTAAVPLPVADTGAGAGAGEWSQQAAMTSGQQIPDGGINIDSDLGVAAPPQQMASASGVAPQIVTSEGAMAMAEGATSQPVVDGIGFDDPQPLASSAPDDQDDGGDILPLAADNGTSGMADAAPPADPNSPQEAAPAEASGMADPDCALYLDKSNCRLR